MQWKASARDQQQHPCIPHREKVSITTECGLEGTDTHKVSKRLSSLFQKRHESSSHLEWMKRLLLMTDGGVDLQVHGDILLTCWNLLKNPPLCCGWKPLAAASAAPRLAASTSKGAVILIFTPRICGGVHFIFNTPSEGDNILIGGNREGVHTSSTKSKATTKQEEWEKKRSWEKAYLSLSRRGGGGDDLLPFFSTNFWSSLLFNSLHPKEV